MHMPLVLTNRRRRGGSASAPAFSPSTLYSSGSQGIWLDPSDLTTMFSDRAGTTPVTTPGTVVGLRLDKSKGLALGSQLVSNGDFSNGTTGWLADNGFAPPSFSVTDGVLTLVNTSGTYSSIKSAITTVIGRSYKISGQVTGGYIDMATSMTGWPASPKTNHVFVATATTTYVTLARDNLGSATFDNISVRELAGNHATAPTDAARPVYGVEPKGGRRNLLTWSEDFGNAVWDIGGITVSTNLVASPVGDVTADKLVENTLYSDHVIYNDNPGITALAGSYTSSAYLKAAGRGFGFVQVAVNGAATRYGVVVDLSTGAVTATSTVGAPTGIAYNVASAGNGWWRISATATHTSGNIYFVSGPSSTGTPSYNPSGTPIYTGDNTSGVFIWGAQLERDA